MSGVNPQGVAVSQSFKQSPPPRGARPRLPAGATPRCAARAAATSGSSTARTTRRPWSSASTPSCSSASSCRRRPAATGLVEAPATARSTTGRRYLADNGIRVVKLFLNLSKEEQRVRASCARIDHPDHNWKFTAADVAGARATGTTTRRRSRRCCPTPAPRPRPGTLSPRTKSGSPGSPRRPSSSTRSWTSTRSSPSWTTPSASSCRTAARPLKAGPEGREALGVAPA